MSHDTRTENETRGFTFVFCYSWKNAQRKKRERESRTRKVHVYSFFPSIVLFFFFRMHTSFLLLLFFFFLFSLLYFDYGEQAKLMDCLFCSIDFWRGSIAFVTLSFICFLCLYTFSKSFNPEHVQWLILQKDNTILSIK